MGYNHTDEYLQLSGIQHFQFCKRQWALIHIEQQWEENVQTIEGQHLHRNTDQPFFREKRGNKLIVRAMPVQSHTLKINGICDVVEFIKDENGVELNGLDGKYVVYPVEYKRGKPKKSDEDVLQLVAQAICLEEMLLCDINTGYLYYNKVRRRVKVPLTDEKKQKVKLIVQQMQDYYARHHTPKVRTGSFCRNCSLQHICLPELMRKQSVKDYIEGKMKE
jgi:CRISPR-associated exonuclease Cas4